MLYRYHGLSENCRQRRGFSGGQRQRLTIARALVGNPHIIILDDASSALDFATDARIRKAIRTSLSTATTFIVTQRTNSIKDANKTIVIDNGKVAVKQATKQGFIYADDGDGINLQFPTSKTRRGRVIKQKSSTLDRQCDCCVLDKNTIRKLSIVELERLQTLPDNYTKGFTDRERKSMIGNGWTVDVIAHIFSYSKEEI